MIRWQTVAGAILGIVAGAVILAVAGGGGRAPAPVTGPILSECEGALRELVIHYEPSARAVVLPVYRDFLGALPREVVVYVVCPELTDFAELQGALGAVECGLRPVAVRHAMTTWSRDRWVALAPGEPGGSTTLWSPRGEAGEAIWPARAGDHQVARDLAVALGRGVRARRSDFYFDGGDFLATGEEVWVAPRVVQRNLQRTVDTREELVRSFGAICKRRVILLDDAPDHHVAMYMVAVGGRRMIVGDPGLARAMIAGNGPAHGALAGLLASLPGGADFGAETQAKFDAVAAQCAGAGYAVARMPVVPAGDGRSYLTYSNVIIEEREGGGVVYLPFFRGAEPLNRAARAVWEGLGYRVRPVDCTSAYRHFGCLHCLVNVLSRG